MCVNEEEDGLLVRSVEKMELGFLVFSSFYLLGYSSVASRMGCSASDLPPSWKGRGRVRVRDRGPIEAHF